MQGQKSVKTSLCEVRFMSHQSELCVTPGYFTSLLQKKSHRWTREILVAASRYIVILIKMHIALIIHCGLFGALVYVHFVSLDMSPTPVVVHSHSNDEFSEPGSVM